MSGEEIIIAIIGGGAAGVVSADTIVRQMKEICGKNTEDIRRIRLRIYEGSDEIGPGSVYRKNGSDANVLDAQMLNLPAKYMSCSPTLTFTQWLSENVDTASYTGNPVNTRSQSQSVAEAYLPRWVYGNYLRCIAASTIREAEQIGIKVEHFPGHFVSRVVITEQSQGKAGYVLEIKDKQGMPRADYIMLCPGHTAPANFETLNRTPKYHPHFSEIAHIGNLEEHVQDGFGTDSICILGSHLSAVEAVLLMRSKGNSRPVTLCSRHGLMPTVQGPINDKFELQYLTPKKLEAEKKLTLAKVTALLRQELAANHVNVETEQDLLAHFRLDNMGPKNDERKNFMFSYGKSESRELTVFLQIHIQLLFGGLYSYIYSRLPDGDRVKFNTTMLSPWLARTMAMPNQTADRIKKEFDDDNISIKGGFKGVKYDASRKKYIVTFTDESEQEFDRVVNCTRSPYNINAVPFLQRLYRDGIIVVDDRGDIVLEADWSLPNHRRLFAVGAMTLGNNPAILDISSLVKQIDSIVPRVITSIQRRFESEVLTRTIEMREREQEIAMRVQQERSKSNKPKNDDRVGTTTTSTTRHITNIKPTATLKRAHLESPPSASGFGNKVPRNSDRTRSTTSAGRHVAQPSNEGPDTFRLREAAQLSRFPINSNEVQGNCPVVARPVQVSTSAQSFFRATATTPTEPSSSTSSQHSNALISPSSAGSTPSPASSP